ncbi:hypothetical protein Taro_043943 [Colocasia esculenta]|uniref:Uncharacterized protein n=1 Tax=Colocasia esculenta TaxID=4460 RepID=A0A843WX06_COLES|nr:hypothetical protein [Colocasia esculenta]
MGGCSCDTKAFSSEMSGDIRAYDINTVDIYTLEGGGLTGARYPAWEWRTRAAVWGGPGSGRRWRRGIGGEGGGGGGDWGASRVGRWGSRVSPMYWASCKKMRSADS